ncbi:hypothetical protein Salat_2805600 [Sesamum alatum]|uniref:Uncharacterized protein n=1 Tax=Sesamum alatum TaxID=300844 RepID=A0AAE2C9G4_9LAMI|nr:hypothetical protein Salat_2805600 [Sesamum alatum]
MARKVVEHGRQEGSGETSIRHVQRETEEEELTKVHILGSSQREEPSSASQVRPAEDVLQQSVYLPEELKCGDFEGTGDNLDRGRLGGGGVDRVGVVSVISSPRSFFSQLGEAARDFLILVPVQFATGLRGGRRGQGRGRLVFCGRREV